MPIQLPEISRAALHDLWAKKQHADLLYNTAVNSAIAALGLDPKENHRLDIDTGIITPAAQDEQQ